MVEREVQILISPSPPRSETEVFTSSGLNSVLPPMSSLGQWPLFLLTQNFQFFLVHGKVATGLALTNEM